MALTPNQALEAVLNRDPYEVLGLPLIHPEALESFPGCDTQDLDEALRHLERDGLISAGERHTGDGSVANWFTLRPTVQGLRQIGQWPPAGGEHLPGPWDEGLWGNADRPVLRDLKNNPRTRDFIFRPTFGAGDEEHQRWESISRLLSAGLVSGEVQSSGLNEVLITGAGERAIREDHEDPLERALVELHRNAKVDAMTAAVEESLAGVLRGLAERHDVDTEDGKGRPLSLAPLNDRLRSADAYDESWRAEIAAWLALRNETNHGRGATVSRDRIARAIAGIQEFRATLTDS